MKKYILIGGTGLLGQALQKQIKKCNDKYITIGLEEADYCVDILNINKVIDIIDKEHPDVVINACAIVNIKYCEENPKQAYYINSLPNLYLAENALKNNYKYVYISTDAYYNNDKNLKHNETYPITLFNEYSRTKYLGEAFSLYHGNSLVIRTNIVGFQNNKSKVTFLEWCIKSLKNEDNITLFTDFYTSSITTTQFSISLIDLINLDASGVYNLASSSVFSKKTFIESLANKLNFSLSKTKDGLVNENLNVKRANSLGLDVSKAEKLLRYSLPNLDMVINQIAEEYYNVK